MESDKQNYNNTYVMALFIRYGAYSAEEIYTEDMIFHIVNFAKYRGIRIILEIDSPAHAGMYC